MAIGIDDAISAVSTTIGKAIDRIWPNPTEEAAAKVAQLKAETENAVALLTAQNAAAVAEASSADPWTSRARPTFLYVMYALILWAIPMSIVSAIRPDVAMNIAHGFAAWLQAIPDSLWSVMFGCFAVYSGGRTVEKVKGVTK